MLRGILAAFLFAAASWAADLTGAWALSIDAGAAHGDTVLELKHEGSKITGVYRGAGGQSPLRGTFKEDSVEFTVTLGNRKMIFKGTVAGDTMNGTMVIPNIEEGRWSARRK